MFKQLLSIALIALVSNTEAIKIKQQAGGNAEGEDLLAMCTEAVAMADADGNGSISTEEITKACEDFGISAGECAHIQTVIEKCDQGAAEGGVKGEVDANELYDCVKSGKFGM